MTCTLDHLPFDNSYARLPEAFHARIAPTPLRRPFLVHFNAQAAELIGLDPEEALREDLSEMLCGARPLPGAEPVAALYAGHQFGHYVHELGDGRAILLGEVCNGRGERWDLQLKGSGRTPFSRTGDGRAVLRSTIREYLCSEAMHALGIPTTRALCLIGSEEPVRRERLEPGAALVRMAPSHLRFGSFEVFFYRSRFDALRELADYVIDHHYPELRDAPEPYLALLQEVVTRTARLIAGWQLVGFAHGVMNTDNMSVLGLTLDYGPFGFMEAYDPGFVCNHSDVLERYAFDRQPQIGLWNLSCFAQALLPLLAPDDGEAGAERARSALDGYDAAFSRAWADGMRAKLGLREARAEDRDLIRGLLETMREGSVDYTNLFRALSRLRADGTGLPPELEGLFAEPEAFRRWAGDYRERLLAETGDDAGRRERMDRTNPRYVLRNHLAQQAIDRAHRGDFAEIDRLLSVLRHPFDDRPEHAGYAAPPPAGTEPVMVSCSS